jgi:hypothetical protein
MNEQQLCEVCGENRAVFAFQEAGVPTRHVCTACHQESLPEPARSLMKAMVATGPCRYCGKPGQAVDASQVTMFRYPYEKDYLCAACQMDFIRTVQMRGMAKGIGNPGNAKGLLKEIEETAREVDLEMRKGA